MYFFCGETHSTSIFTSRTRGKKMTSQGIHERMVRFQKLIQTLFNILHGHSIHCQQRKLSRFLMHCQQFVSHEQQDQFPRSRRSRWTLSVCSVLRCPDLWLLCSVSFVHGLKKDILVWCVFFKPCTKLTLHCKSQIWSPQNGAHRKPSPAATPLYKTLFSDFKTNFCSALHLLLMLCHHSLSNY
jgi:hypothetical protein